MWRKLFFLWFAVPALAVNICQYQAPTTNLLRGEASFHYQYAENPLTPGVDTSAGKLALLGEWVADAPVRGVGLAFRGDLGFQELRLASAYAHLSGTFREYPFPALSYFVFGGVEGTLDTKYTRPFVEARAGVGYGRFTDVTPLVRALRLEEKLLREGVLLAALPEKVLFRLAEEIGRREMYASTGDLAVALTKILTAEIGLALDPSSIPLIEETLDEPGFERYCGWAVQFGLGYAVSRPQPGTPLTFNFSLQGAVTPDPRSQILFKSDLSAPYQVFEEYSLSLGASYAYRLNDTTAFSAQYSLQQVKPRGQMPAGTQSVAFQLVFKVGGTTVTLELKFSKLAEMREWVQELTLSAGWQLW